MRILIEMKLLRLHAGTGFADLPREIQAHILNLHLAAHRGTGDLQSRIGVRAVCRAFKAHSDLHAHATQHVDITPSAQSAALLPYSPHLQTLVCSATKLPFQRMVHAILASPLHLMPQLRSLTLHCHTLVDIPSVVAAVAGNTQLTALSHSATLTTPRQYYGVLTTHPQPGLELPHLPLLRKLSLQLPCIWLDVKQIVPCNWDWDMTLPFGLATLSEMRLLTSLAFHSAAPLEDEDDFFRFDNEDDEDGVEPDTTQAMVAASDALVCLTELRKLSLSNWTTGASTPELLCWRALACALPALQHLTHLDLLQVYISRHLDPNCILALASALPSLTALHSLTITGSVDSAAHGARGGESSVEFEQQRADVNAPLARAVGSLATLTRFELSRMQDVLELSDCCLHMRALSVLQSLTLVFVQPEPDTPAQADTPPTSPGRGAEESACYSPGYCGISQLLHGMPQLTTLCFFCGVCGSHVTSTHSRSDPA